jgi:DNA topoisomerase-1
MTIEKMEVQGKTAVVAWFNDKFELVDKDDATLVKITWPDDGQVVFLKRDPKNVVMAQDSRDQSKRPWWADTEEGMITSDAYDPNEPRDKAGRWTELGAHRPDHIRDLKIPPAWKNVLVNHNPKSNLYVTGIDAKGRKQYIYNPAFKASQAANKFRRIVSLEKKIGSILQQNNHNRLSNNDTTAQHADILHLISQTGIRPGDDADRGGAVKAYGATTLLGKHVTRDGNKARLHFVGKKGVSIDMEVGGSAGRMLLDRKNKDDEELFPDVTRQSLSQYLKTLDPHFKTKDFRTLLATQTAQDLVDSAPVPKSITEYKRAVKAVAKVVAEKLGNTPAVALSSYIAPQIFGHWQQVSGVHA